jgi:hypothetical protein
MATSVLYICIAAPLSRTLNRDRLEGLAYALGGGGGAHSAGGVALSSVCNYASWEPRQHPWPLHLGG